MQDILVYVAVLTVSPKEIRASLEGNRGIARTMQLCQNCVICGKWNKNVILFLFYIKNSKAIDYDHFLICSRCSLFCGASAYTVLFDMLR